MNKLTNAVAQVGFLNERTERAIYKYELLLTPRG